MNTMHRDLPSSCHQPSALLGRRTPLVLATVATLIAAAAADAQTPRARTGTPTTRPSGAMTVGTTESTPEAKTYPQCSQSHAGRSYRVKRLATDGDSKVTKSVAGHTVLYARERFGLADITSDADYDRAVSEMYDFLKWKLGNPSLVASQWVSAGYQHFDSHADEAAAALLGVELPGPAAEVRLPKVMSDWLKAEADSAGADFCTQLGDSTIVGFTCEVLEPYVREAIAKSIDRIGISSATLIGKTRYDVKTAEIELLVHLRRHPMQFLPWGRKSVLGRAGGAR